jgi:hypothetical protein
MSENDIVAPNMEHAYWGVKCKNPECQHYILREDLSLQPEGIVGIPPEPYPNFDQACEHCGQTHMYGRNDVQIVQGTGGSGRDAVASCPGARTPNNSLARTTRDSENSDQRNGNPATNRNPASALTRRSGP